MNYLTHCEAGPTVIVYCDDAIVIYGALDLHLTLYIFLLRLSTAQKQSYITVPQAVIYYIDLYDFADNGPYLMAWPT